MQFAIKVRKGRDLREEGPKKEEEKSFFLNSGPLTVLQCTQPHTLLRSHNPSFGT